jgi:hypothetical protein
LQGCKEPCDNPPQKRNKEIAKRNKEKEEKVDEGASRDVSSTI